MAYVRRVIDTELDELFPHLAAIAIDGAKGVGKTATSRERAASVINLDDPAERESVLAYAEGFLTRPRPLLIDEWQHVPSVWDTVRRAVDDDNAGGQFLLTGSATPRAGATAHSGAGRVVRIRMRPMTLAERGIGTPSLSLRGFLDSPGEQVDGRTEVTLRDYVRAMTTSGFPGLQGLPPRVLRAQLDSYLQNIVDRDVIDQGLTVRRPAVMLDWMRAYAAATSTTAAYTQILNAATAGIDAKPSRKTTTAYRDMLAQLWILDPVPAWTPFATPLDRLAQSSKHHLADPALAIRLLGLSEEALLDGKGTPVGPQEGTMLGHLFESLVTLCVRVYAQAAEAHVGHLRTRNGDHEVDLIVTRPDGGFVALEVKLAETPNDRDVRHLHWLREHAGDRMLDAVVITTGRNAYRRRDGIAVVPLALLGP